MPYLDYGTDTILAQAQRQLVLYAVQRQIFCPDCSGVLDVDDAVAYTPDSGGATVACGRCWDSNIADAARQTGKPVDEVAEILRGDDDLALVDGRKL
jgi:hypothetical protein